MSLQTWSGTCDKVYENVKLKRPINIYYNIYLVLNLLGIIRYFILLQ